MFCSVRILLTAAAGGSRAAVRLTLANVAHRRAGLWTTNHKFLLLITVSYLRTSSDLQRIRCYLFTNPVYGWVASSNVMCNAGTGGFVNASSVS